MNSSKESDIKKLVQFIDPHSQNVEWLKTLFSTVTPLKENERGRFLEEMNADMVSALYYPIYDQYFSHDEIKELIKFYSSKTGCKLARYKSNNIPAQFMAGELEEIEQFKKTRTGKKYNSLLDKITHQHVESVEKYIDSLTGSSTGYQKDPGTHT
ncbi:MAG: DUF2059 domain-containing protein [Candidatus Omnitrophica bacterium]|nr:DUF2059 domain-containing protein [Candidatus Omnitrophota bacterium]